MRHAFVWAFRILFTAAILAALWGGAYLATRGFTKEWRDLVTAEIRKQGIDVSMRKLTLDPVNGLVAREVRVVDSENKKRVLARVDRIALDVNFANLIAKEPFLDALELRDAHLALPLDPKDKNSKQLQVDGLNARILFPPGQLYVARLEGSILGIGVRANGRLVNFDVRERRKSEEKPQKTPTEWLTHVEALSREFEFAATPPELEVRFSGDMWESKQIFAEANFTAHDFKFRGCPITRFQANAAMRDGKVELRGLSIKDSLGKLDASGDYDLDSKRVLLDLRSSIDARPFFAILNNREASESLVFRSVPKLELSGELNFQNGRAALTGRFEWGRFAVRGAEFDSASGGLAWDGSRLMLDDLSVQSRTGHLSARALNVPGDFRLILDSTINPRDLAPLLSGKAAEIMREWDFTNAPILRLKVAGPALDIARCEAFGELQLGRTKFRNVPLRSATAKVRVKDGACTYEDFRVERDEGVGTGTFTYDFARSEVRLNKVRTSLIPADVAMWIDPKMVRDFAPYRFKGPPNISVDGTVTFNGRRDTKLFVGIDSPKGMDYTFLKKTLSFPAVKAMLEFTDRRLRILDLEDTLYGGRMRGEADISLKKEDKRYSAEIHAEAVDFPKLTKLYFNYDDSRGKMDGSFRWAGEGSDARTLDGYGDLEVRNGNVFAIPIFGPLSGFLNNVVPGTGYHIARRGTANVRVRNGAIETHDLKIEGNGFEMLGGGRLFYLDDKMNFTIRINAQGVPGAILSPVSHLFEYVSDGSLSKPVWKPKRLPSLKPALPSARGNSDSQ